MKSILQGSVEMVLLSEAGGFLRQPGIERLGNLRSNEQGGKGRGGWQRDSGPRTTGRQLAK